MRLGPNPDKTGYAEIADFRQTAWKTLTSRKHIIGKVYVFSQNDVFLRGTVEYNFKDGSYKKVEWCGNMVFDKELREKGQVKIKFYHVFFKNTSLKREFYRHELAFISIISILSSMEQDI